jgi:hypothetical protein
MTLWTPAGGFSGYVDNWGTNPGSGFGTAVTPGASDAEGNWTEIFSDLPWEASAIFLHIHSGNTSAQIKRHVLDIGWDPAGGTSYVEKIANIVCGASQAGSSGGMYKFFPIRIPAGAAVAVRIRGSNSTAGTVRVAAKIWGQPSAPWMFPVGQYSETLGVSGSNGTSFTPGTGADGSWVSLGTTTRPLWWWQLCWQVSASTITGEQTFIELAHGDASFKHIMQRLMMVGTTGETLSEALFPHILWPESYYPLPAGAELFVRGRCLNAPDSGYQAAVVGIGG